MGIRWVLAACAAVLVSIGGQGAHAGLITINDHYVFNSVGPSGDGDNKFFFGTVLDIDHTLISNHGDSTYETRAQLTQDALEATILYTWDGSTAATGSHQAQSLAVLKFTANSDDLSYALSGSHSFSRIPDDYSTIYSLLYAQLKDVTTNTVLFENLQTDTYAPGPFTYELGGTLFFNPLFPASVSGSLNGALINGHVYELVYSAEGRYGGVTTFGDVQLNITSEAQAVPEPASLVLFGLGTLGMGVVARYRRNGLALTSQA